MTGEWRYQGWTNYKEIENLEKKRNGWGMRRGNLKKIQKSEVLETLECRSEIIVNH